jgi:hypothetical protein
LTDPQETVSPQFYAGYDIRASKAAEWITLPSIVPHIAKTFFEQVKSLEDINLSEVSRVTGSKYRQRGIAGGKLIIPAPAGQGLHVRGSFDPDPLVGWLETTSLERLQTDGPREWFGRTSKQSYEAFVVGDGVFIYGSRDQVDTTPEAILETELEAFDGNAASANVFAPDIFHLGDDLDDGTIRVATGFAHLPLASDTGVEAFDDVIPGVVAGGLSADLGEQVSVQRVLRYLEGKAVTPDTLGAAFDAAANGEGGLKEPRASWSTSTDGQQVTGKTEVPLDAIRSTPAFLTRVLPSPGYESLYNPINPQKLGRKSPPSVALKVTLSDGRVSLEYLGGKIENDLRVRYVHKGTPKRESWSAPFEDGDTFKTAKTVDSDTEVWVIGKPDTINASVVSRILA